MAVYDHSFDGDMNAQDAPAGATYELDETYWGYIIRDIAPPSASTVIAQALALVFGISFAIATVGMWVFGSNTFNDDLLIFRLVASIVTAALSGLLLWFATRGEKVEVQVDTSLGEVREVMRNRQGRVSLVGRYGFDSFCSVDLDRKGRRDSRVCLTLRIEDPAHVVPIVEGDPSSLQGLQDRISRDLMMGSLRSARFDSVESFEQLAMRKASAAT